MESSPLLDIQVLLFGGFALVSITFVVFVIHLLARKSKWKRFVEAYPARTPMQGRTVRNLQVKIGDSYYGGHALSLTLDASHLHVRPVFLLRPSHSPFSIPWSDLKVKSYRTDIGVPVLDLRCRSLSGVLIELAGRSAQRVMEASEGRIQPPDAVRTVADIVDDVIGNPSRPDR